MLLASHSAFTRQLDRRSDQPIDQLESHSFEYVVSKAFRSNTSKDLVSCQSAWFSCC
ncbi:hypothetical protein SynBIOSE41_03746 [Synechococcus sp. BIOS-E4-1]|nr:hypothetical protein SynBIOSE41_03746 [Synechococcus sp. BIOS-E4-1]